jgi:hypothetical protein
MTFCFTRGETGGLGCCQNVSQFTCRRVFVLREESFKFCVSARRIHAPDIHELQFLGTISVELTYDLLLNYSRSNALRSSSMLVLLWLPAATYAQFTDAPGSPFAVGRNPVHIVSGDFNGDGRLDLAIANSDSNKNVTVLLGNANGGFTEAPGSPFSVGAFDVYSIVAGDFNRDGNLDLAVGNNQPYAKVSGVVTVLLGDGRGSFSLGSSFPATVFAVGDFNGDGNADLVIVDGGTVTVLLGNGAGEFTAAPESPYTTGTQSLSLVVGDFNRDGNADIAVANWGDPSKDVNGSVAILLGDGAGRFTFASGSPYPVASSPNSIAMADFNGDGNQDLATANVNGNSISVLLGNGAGGFTTGPGSPIPSPFGPQPPPFGGGSGPYSIAAGDFDGDGIPDLAVANLLFSKFVIYRGDGTGNFTVSYKSSTAAGGTSPVFIATGDFDGNGTPDLVVTNYETNSVSVFLNQYSPSSAVSTPAITSVSPNSAVSGGPGFALTVTGTGFDTSSQVQWNGSPLATLSAGAGRLTALVTASLVASAGVANVTVINRSGRVSGISRFVIAATCPSGIVTGTTGFNSDGGGASFTVNAVSACAWQAHSDSLWIQVIGPSPGGLVPFSGSTNVNFLVQPNNTRAARSGSISVGPQKVTISQAALACVYNLVPGYGSFPAAGGDLRIVINTGPGCPWTESNSATWLSPASASGSGTGAVLIHAQSNSGPSRAANIVVAGQPFVVSQEATTATVCGAVDIKSQVSVNQSGITWIPPFNLYTNTITVRNVSGSVVRGPINLVMAGLPTHLGPPYDISIDSATGITTCFSARGDYTITISGDLGPGQSAGFSPVYIRQSASFGINYSLRVFSGQLSR